jgi:hypothetical protein
VRRILICAPDSVAKRLEDKLRHKFDVEVKIVSDDVCEIKGKIKRDWVSICRFAHNENLNDVLTMFEVNYELKNRPRN